MLEGKVRSLPTVFITDLELTLVKGVCLLFFRSLLTTFEMNCIFRGSLGMRENWFDPTIKSSYKQGNM